MLQPGVRLGERYRLDERLGAGGMGEVWRAVDELLRRHVAVKAMLPSVADDPDFARRFLAEATSMARVNHPAVASIHDFGTSQGVTYLVMELVDGESLAQLLGRVGRLGPAETMRVIAQAADGLQAVHDQGVVHRDIKPANLLVRRDGSVLITDFGIARHADASRLTASGAILGTPTYLSPEQVMGQAATPLSDIYSLGLTAYECLAGQKPFVGDNPYAVALQRLQQGPRTIGVTLPVPVMAVVERALAVEPGQRWQSAGALAAAARATDSDSPFVAAPPSVAAPSARRPRKAVAAVAAAILVLVVAGVAWAVAGSRGKVAAGGTPFPKVTSTEPAGLREAGLVVCGKAFCPAEPMCWGGLTAISGKAMPPSPVDCTTPHYWETFAAIPLPADAATIRADSLIEQPDVARACSASLMASRSRDPKATTTWLRDAWPIQLPGNGAWLLHCIARPRADEATAPAF